MRLVSVLQCEGESTFPAPNWCDPVPPRTQRLHQASSNHRQQYFPHCLAPIQMSLCTVMYVLPPLQVSCPPLFPPSTYPRGVVFRREVEPAPSLKTFLSESVVPHKPPQPFLVVVSWSPMSDDLLLNHFRCPPQPSPDAPNSQLPACSLLQWLVRAGGQAL